MDFKDSRILIAIAIKRGQDVESHKKIRIKKIENLADAVLSTGQKKKCSVLRPFSVVDVA